MKHSKVTIRDITNESLTPGNVALFQRFRQKPDIEQVNLNWDKELDRHLELCELSILYMAQLDCYWCELPNHPILDISILANRELEGRGFKIEHFHTAREIELPLDYNKEMKVKVTEANFRTTASWLHIKYTKEQKAEFSRRYNLERAEINKIIPKLKSKVGKGGELKPIDGVIWSAILDKKYIIEIQRLTRTKFLCIFDMKGKYLHHEEINLSYGAKFGPDVGDIAEWEKIAIKFIDNLKKKKK